MERGQWTGWLGALAASGCGFAGGLGASRAAYEALFPRALWLGRVPAVLGLALLGGLLALLLWRRLAAHSDRAAALAPLLPLLLSLVWLFDPTVRLAESRFLLFLALWLLLALLLRLWTARLWPAATWLALLVAGTYLLTLGRHVGRADTFEFQVTAPRLGIAHPTGYPLYLLLSKPFTWLPFGTVAARVNLATAFFGVLAVLLLFLLLWRLGGRRLPASLAALLFALSPTFWSQAVEAEVYTLHNLIVGAALLLMIMLLQAAESEPRNLIALAFVLGLGLTNHLTTLLLFPAALLTIVLVARRARWNSRQWLRLLPRLALAFVLPLLLYLYLPLRWAAVNGEPMGFTRFIDWVVGGRFQGALQLRAWLDDPARYGVVARLLLAEWRPAWLLLLAIPGVLWLGRRNWPVAAVLLLVWAAFVFYALNYYVPDLNVFLLPAQMILALCWGLGLAALWQLLDRRYGVLPATALALLLAAPLLFSAAGRWTQMDRSRPDARVAWAQGVLAQPLAQGAAILADSEKFPPLYYLQQAEGLRPDLDIIVLPDEPAYRAELGARLAEGQTVYLARLLPGLEGQYHLRSAGPLLEVGTTGWDEAPAESTYAALDFGSIRLLGYHLEPEAAIEPGAAAITFYWQATETPAEPYYVFTRRSGSDGQPGGPPAGQHPANNSYPTVAWEPGEVVADFHLLPRPLLASPREFALQVALAPPFTPPDELDWQTVTTLELPPPDELAGTTPVRVWMEAHYLQGVTFPEQVRPEETFSVLLEGDSQSAVAGTLELLLLPAESAAAPEASCTVRLGTPAQWAPALWNESLVAPAGAGRYRLWTVTHACLEDAESAEALCGWLAPASGSCPLGEIEVSGVALPEGATNFGDRIALLDISADETALQPGGILPVTLTWQGLGRMQEDYTVTVQVLDEQDRIVGQVDSWPLQGTYPTSQWPAGERVRDPYEVRLEQELPPGNYRLLVGWYLLSTGQRLPVLDDSGAAVDDKVILPGFVVPESGG